MSLRSLSRWGRSFISAAVVLAGVLAGQAGEPAPGGDDWKYDTVFRRKGPPFRGLVLEESATHVLMKCVSRKPGAPTVVIREWLPRQEVARVEYLEPGEREQLRRRLQALAREREELTARLKSLDPTGKEGGHAGEELPLQTVAWPTEPREGALAYASTHFRLVSNARPEVVRLAAIQLEQVYAAYARFLPPRVAPGPPTTILLTRSLPDYQALVRDRQGGNLFNLAFFDPEKNQVACASDLERLAGDLEQTRRTHQRLRSDLKDREADLQAAYKGRVPPELLRGIRDDGQKIRAAEERNDAAFREAQGRLFRRLYHEAFHAYLANFVYPAREGAVPGWLNEGLAQIFETALVEAGELRVGHADLERLAALRLARERGTLPPLAELLRARARQFQVAHAADKQVSDRFYLASWGLAFYLTFDRRLLGTAALDDYVRAPARGADPLASFALLVGRPLPQFEQEYLDYLKNLKTDGTVGRK